MLKAKVKEDTYTKQAVSEYYFDTINDSIEFYVTRSSVKVFEDTYNYLITSASFIFKLLFFI